MLSVKRTRNWLLSLIAGVLLGCATAPAANPWDSVEIPSEVIETPLPCYELPEPVVLDDIGQGRIDAMRECAMANYDIASEHIVQIESMRDATRDLVDAGQHQRRIAEMKQEMLNDERKSNFFEKIGLYAVILGMGLAL